MFKQSETMMFGEYPFYDYCWYAECDICRRPSISWGKDVNDIRAKSDKEGWTFKRGKASEPSKHLCPKCG